MNSVELVISICKERNIPISKLERDCDFSNGYIKRLKEGKFPSNRLQKIAEYLDIPLAYLLTGDEKHLNVHAGGHPGWYADPETAREAQRVFDDPDLRMLFDAARDSKPENIRLAAEMLRRFKDTSNDG